MELINFIDDSEPEVSAENLNKLQNNVKTAIEETESKLREEIETESKAREAVEAELESKINGKCFYLNAHTLTYLNQTTLSTTFTVNGLGAIESKSIVLISCMALDGTPHASIISLSYKTNGDELTIYASAPSFVDGHVLSVKVMIYYNG